MKRHLLHCAPWKFELLLFGRTMLLLGEFLGYIVLAEARLGFFAYFIIIVSVLEAH